MFQKLAFTFLSVKGAFNEECESVTPEALCAGDCEENYAACIVNCDGQGSCFDLC